MADSLPPWLPGVVVAMLPNIVCRMRHESAALHRLTHDPRMRRVFSELARLTPARLTTEHAISAVFTLAYHTAAEARPVMLKRERAHGIKMAGGWAQWFMSPASLGEGVAVSHMPDDPVAKRMQLMLTIWFERTYGGPHRGVVHTICEVALGREVSPWTGRRRRSSAKPVPMRASGC